MSNSPLSASTKIGATKSTPVSAKSLVCDFVKGAPLTRDFVKGAGSGIHSLHIMRSGYPILLKKRSYRGVAT